MPKIVDKPQAAGGKLYAVRYDDGHESREMSLPEARAAFAATGRKGKRDQPWKRR